MFLLTGMLATMALWALLRPVSLVRRIALAALPLLLLAFLSFTGLTLRSAEAWWQNELWRNGILFVLMLAGMMFRVTSDAVEEYRTGLRAADGTVKKARRKPRFDRWDFVYPALASLVVFQSVLWMAKTQQLSYELSLASFQNGFFWTAVLNRSRAATEAARS